MFSVPNCSIPTSANSIYVSANNVFLSPNNVGVPASIISVSSNASPVQLFVSNGPIPTNNTPTSATPAYGMPSYSELGDILTRATQNEKVRARLLRYARPANMPANKEISKPMQRRLISSMLIDIDPQQYDEIIQAILPNTASNLFHYGSMILYMLPSIGYNQRSEMIGWILTRALEDHDEDQYDQWIKEMLPFILKPSLTVSEIIAGTKHPSEEVRKNMVKFVLATSALKSIHRTCLYISTGGSRS